MMRMADSPPFRTGYLSVLLPVRGRDQLLRRTIRKTVIAALGATGERAVRV